MTPLIWPQCQTRLRWNRSPVGMGGEQHLAPGNRRLRGRTTHVQHDDDPLGAQHPFILQNVAGRADIAEFALRQRRDGSPQGDELAMEGQDGLRIGARRRDIAVQVRGPQGQPGAARGKATGRRRIPLHRRPLGIAAEAECRASFRSNGSWTSSGGIGTSVMPISSP